MSEKRPADDEPIEAQIVGEDAEAPEEPETPEERRPPAVDAEVVGEPPAPTYVPPPADSALPVVLLVAGLLVVLLLSVLFRVQLVELYDRVFATSLGETAVPVVGKTSPGSRQVGTASTSGGAPATVVPRPGDGETDNAGGTREVPKFERRELPKLPAERGPDIPASERTRGYGYSRLERLDLTRDGVSRQQIKVMVPAHYGEAELRLVAEDVIARERKLGECHALRLFFFTDPEKTEPADAVAEAVWAPEGKFIRAAEAVRAGSDRNTLVIRIIDR
ncbi:MAG TPA: hypothetical protein VMX57_05270 [Planctomycetota bacterium]|nr:hypothetical protein [Planctomycetota bacterium]